MDEDEFLKMLLTLIADAGGKKPLARRLGVSEAYLGEVARGLKAPGAKILDPLGLQRKVTYELKEKEKTNTHG